MSFVDPVNSQLTQWGPMEGEGMGLKFIPVIVRHLLGPLRMFGPLAGTSWTHMYVASPNSSNGGFNPPPAAHPPPPSTPHPFTHPSPIMCHP